MSEVVPALELLPILKDMARSTSYFQAMSDAHGGINMNAITGSKLQTKRPANEESLHVTNSDRLFMFLFILLQDQLQLVERHDCFFHTM